MGKEFRGAVPPAANGSLQSVSQRARLGDGGANSVGAANPKTTLSHKPSMRGSRTYLEEI